MYVTSGRTRVKAWAPAKLNLFLEVLGRRTDGFHELDTLMLPINLWDTLIADPTEDSSIQLHAEWAVSRPRGSIDHSGSRGIGVLPWPEHNLVYRAFELVRKTHCEPRGLACGAVIHLWKRIPSEAGLGGGSSDAAAAIVMANRIWNLQLPLNEMERLAAQLGSDVPFFLHSATCVCRGRGEIITPIPNKRTLFFVILKPPIGLSTREVFRQTELPPNPVNSKRLVAELATGSLQGIGKESFNRLQTAAIRQSDSIQYLESTFNRLGVVSHQLTGSGSCYFGLCRSKSHARHIAQQLNSKKLGVAYAVTSANFPTSRRLQEQPSQN